jgi:hypothetical protein
MGVGKTPFLMYIIGNGSQKNSPKRLGYNEISHNCLADSDTYPPFCIPAVYCERAIDGAEFPFI